MSLKVFKHTGSTWSQVGSDLPPSIVDQAPLYIRINNGIIYVIYFITNPGTLQREPYCAKWDGISWTELACNSSTYTPIFNNLQNNDDFGFNLEPVTGSPFIFSIGPPPGMGANTMYCYTGGGVSWGSYGGPGPSLGSLATPPYYQRLVVAPQGAPTEPFLVTVYMTHWGMDLSGRAGIYTYYTPTWTQIGTGFGANPLAISVDDVGMMPGMYPPDIFWKNGDLYLCFWTWTGGSGVPPSVPPIPPGYHMYKYNPGTDIWDPVFQDPLVAQAGNINDNNYMYIKNEITNEAFFSSRIKPAADDLMSIQRWDGITLSNIHDISSLAIPDSIPSDIEPFRTDVSQSGKILQLWRNRNNYKVFVTLYDSNTNAYTYLSPSIDSLGTGITPWDQMACGIDYILDDAYIVYGPPPPPPEPKIYLSQRTSRHTVKKLDSSYSYENNFGSWGTIKTDNTGLNFPWGITADISNDIYVCDGNNKRIVKLDSLLNYVSNVDVSSTIGTPHAIFYDSINSDLYVAGIKDYKTISIARITTSLSISKYKSDIVNVDATNRQPVNISRGFNVNDFLISGMKNLYRVTENGSFSTASIQSITGETGSFFGHIKHSNGDLYMNVKYDKRSKISRVDSSYTNTGDSNIISKQSKYITENSAGDILIYNSDENKVTKYDQNLNFIEDIYQDSGSTVELDAKEIYGIIEINL